jgi:drug/metabolite transporter (DMT)-like permease
LQSRVTAAFRWIWGQPYILLFLVTLFWGGNVVAGKLAVGQVSPMAVTFLRWLIACGALVFVARKAVVREWRIVAPRWFYILVMAGLAFTGFNALFYSAAYYTTGVNIAIIQGSTPVFMLAGMLVLGAPFSILQGLGIGLTLAGVVLTASHADLAVLRNLAFSRGDLWLLTASIFYAIYSLALRWRPQASPLVFFCALAAAACVTSIPLLVWEWEAGRLQWPTPFGWVVILYIALLPSLICQILYIRGIELIGPARAGAFYNLVPVFGAMLSAVMLGEPFAAYHVVALGLVLGGIAVAERGRG